MATISLHDIAVQNDGKVVHITGISRLDFSPTEVRLDLGFNLSLRTNGHQYPMGLSRLVGHYHYTVTDIDWARGRVQAAARDKANAAMSMEGVRPEGRASADIPFDFVLDLADWLCFIDEEFGRLPEYAQEIAERLRVAVKADLSMNIYGGSADCLIPQWPDHVDPETIATETETSE